MTLTRDDFTISTKGYLLYHGQPVHRLIAGPLSGNALQPDDVVHHKNGNKLDCRPQNLEALPRNEHHSYLAPFGVEQVITLPSQDWLDKLEALLPARPRSPDNQTIGFYFTPQHNPNAIRRRLAEIAAELGYFGKRGPTAKSGSPSELLAAIANGEITLVKNKPN